MRDMLLEAEVLEKADRQHLFLTTNKLWQLLEIAIEDIQIVSKMPGYIISMNTWHEKVDDMPNMCTVCLAGSVLARTLNWPKTENYNIKNGNDWNVQKRMLAIDCVRARDIGRALFFFCVDEKTLMEYIHQGKGGDIRMDFERRYPSREFTTNDWSASSYGYSFIQGITHTINKLKERDL